jgi:Xaa-Pro aminopeptidase
MKTKTNGTRLIVAASDQDADMFYATRFWAGDPFIFLQQNGKRTIVLTDLEMGRGRRTAKVDEFVSYNKLEGEVRGKDRQSPSFEKVLAHFLRRRKVKRATVPSSFPLGYARELDVDLTTTNGMFWPQRAAKTDEELKLIGRALRITEAGMARAMEVLRRSTIARDKKLKWSGKTLTSEILRAEIDTAMLHAGGQPTNTIVAGGDQACDPHERGSGPLRANELIIFDIFPRDPKSGYWGDMTRTVVRGRASEAQRKLWQTVKDGQELALKRIKAGVDGMSIHKAIQKLFDDHGYKTEVRNGKNVGFFHGTGHGLGLEIHEHPRLQKVVLQDRQVVTVEPGLYYPGLGGVRIEDVVAVTKRGCKILSRFPKQLEI